MVLSTSEKEQAEQSAVQVEPSGERYGGHWPQGIAEAYSRSRGPYTVENVDALLQEEPIELINGWLVWQTMTDIDERQIAANIQVALDLSARQAGFGQGLPDQVECELADGSVIKPDVCLISWDRLENGLVERGPKLRKLIKGGPELVVELHSPSNTLEDARIKREKYLANGVSIVWDVHPLKQTIRVYRAENPTEAQEFSNQDTIDCELFLKGWRRKVADLFDQKLDAKTLAGEVAEAWQAEGRAEGLEEGRAEGELKQLREMLPRLARLRFGPALPSELAGRLARCNLAQLEELSASIETSPALADWLMQLPE